MTGPVEGSDLFLALESSAAVGTVAVGTGDGTVRAEVVLEERRQHAARLVPAVGEALEAAGVDPGELAGVLVGAGPGSFTGVRVAAATAKGLCHALGVPLRAASSLAAAALARGTEKAGAGPGGVRYVLFDARGDRVYGACYRVGEGLETLSAPHAGTLRDVLEGDVPEGAVFVGDGSIRHREALERAGFDVEPPPAGRPTARALLRWLALHPTTPPLADPAGWEPAYLRASNAERAWSG